MTTVAEKYTVARRMLEHGIKPYALLALVSAVLESIPEYANEAAVEMARQLKGDAPYLMVIVPVLGFFFSMLVISFTVSLFILLTDRLFRHQRIDYHEMIRIAFARLWDVTSAMIISTVYILLWGLLLIVPGIIKAYAYLFVPYVVLLENVSAKDSRHASSHLMEGLKWPTAKATVPFYGVVLLLFMGLVGALEVLLLGTLPPLHPLEIFLLALLDALTNFLFMLPGIVIFLFYKEAIQDNTRETRISTVKRKDIL